MVESDSRQSHTNTLHYLSLRWRFIAPLALVVMAVAMLGTYAIANRLVDNFAISEENLLIQSSQSVANRAGEIYERQRTEALRVAFTQGLSETVQAQQATALHDILVNLAAAAELDSIIVTDANGVEIAGVLHTEIETGVGYNLSSNSNLSGETLVRSVLDEGIIGATGLLRTPEGVMLYTGVPIRLEDAVAGTVLVGQRLQHVVEALQASAIADVTLFGADGTVLQSTFDLGEESIITLAVSLELVEQTLSGQHSVLESFNIAGTSYRSIYTPFVFGENALGITGTMISDNVPFAAEIGRQATALFASALAGAVVVAAVLGISRITNRIEKVAETAQALADGKAGSRTRMQVVDEVGAVGQALDSFAELVQVREDQFRDLLRRERRERAYLLSVLESIPDGIVVQDKIGKVILVNNRARDLFGTQQAYNQYLPQLTDSITKGVGESLAPGIYALGDPQQVQHNGKMLSVQAAAVLSQMEVRIGTVLIVRDITDEVKQTHLRDKLLSQLSQDIQQPLANLAQTGALDTSAMVNLFAREISRHAASLQKMIVDMRELTQYSPTQARQMQRPLQVETLIWAVANDWRQIAQAAGLQLQVMIEKNGLYVLGDESRLRWAIGNLVDNAIKYTPSEGKLTLEVKDVVNGLVHLRIRDNGVGISKEDLEHVFMPFYRGMPRTADGEVFRVPGMGQGLPLSKQIIEAHGGLMKVKSRVGVGTAVYFALPVTSGATFVLPLLESNTMEGETVQLPHDMDIESLWRKK